MRRFVDSFLSAPAAAAPTVAVGAAGGRWRLLRPPGVLAIIAAACFSWPVCLRADPAAAPAGAAGSGVHGAKEPAVLRISRADYANRLHGFWLGQCIGNWTGLVTEMDRIGGPGPHGRFYTREDWGGPDHPSIWSDAPSELSPTIDWVLVGAEGVWGADDDTDIEYLYQHLLYTREATTLTGEQIRDGWLEHIWSEEDTPFVDGEGKPENFLWVSNQRAFELMRERGLAPPATSDPKLNPHVEMIDAQLTTEIFGLFAPARPDVALRLGQLPIRTTARGEAALAAEFYVIMHALASAVDRSLPADHQVAWLAQGARSHLPDDSTTARMFDFVAAQHRSGVPWEAARDAVYQRYQVEQRDGYDMTSRDLYCNGCFASGINFAASIVSLLYGEGDFRETVKIAVLAGWDADNPAATWGGLLGFLHGRDGIERAFGRTFSERFDIHRTRRGFPNEGMDTFTNMARRGVLIVDRVVSREIGGTVDLDGDAWSIPLRPASAPAPDSPGSMKE